MAASESGCTGPRRAGYGGGMSTEEPGVDVPHVVFDYTPAELERVNRAWSARAVGGPGAFALRHAPTVVVGAVFVLLLKWVGAAVFVLGYAYFLYARTRAGAAATVAAQARARGLGGMFEVWVNADALLMRAAIRDITVPWRGVSVEEHDGDVILDLPHARVPIPGRAFVDLAARERFVTAVRARKAAEPPLLVQPAGVPSALTRGDHHAAAFLALRGGPVPVVIGFVLLGHVGMAIVFTRFGEPVMPGAEMARGIFFSLALWAGLILGPVVGFAELAWRRGRSLAAMHATVLLTAEGVRYVGDTTAVTVPWSQVAVLRTHARGVLFREGAAWRLVPRRGFADDGAFRAFAAEAERLWRAGRGS
jgi:hypothetical protein